MNRPTNQGDNSEAKEKVKRLKGLMKCRKDGGVNGIGLSKVIAIFRNDYIEPIFRGPQRAELDLEAVKLSRDIIEDITSNAGTVLADGISSIGNILGVSQHGNGLSEDVYGGLGFLLEDLGSLQAEIQEIDSDIALSLAARLEKELKEKEQLVEATAIKAL